MDSLLPGGRLQISVAGTLRDKGTCGRPELRSLSHLFLLCFFPRPHHGGGHCSLTCRDHGLCARTADSSMATSADRHTRISIRKKDRLVQIGLTSNWSKPPGTKESIPTPTWRHVAAQFAAGPAAGWFLPSGSPLHVQYGMHSSVEKGMRPAYTRATFFERSRQNLEPGRQNHGCRGPQIST
ncbi:hypothetical protein CKAH01_06129 [Colletotrichum kahawae]|uniref:Uncharacterized protein n=1 Tax=Colletotrichum kahawae TaxID=34407 RepID=A0AAE0D4P6_COLKA|nr:hypothetical protein CKAH01_06129 [Colletotrichum kahawae]